MIEHVEIATVEDLYAHMQEDPLHRLEAPELGMGDFRETGYADPWLAHRSFHS